MFVLQSCYRSGKFSLTDFVISKPFLIPLEWTLMALTIFLGRDAFIGHVCIVTFLLLVILHKINKLYGPFTNPHSLFLLAVLGGGSLHVVVPIIGTYFEVAMYVHLGICFMVHVLHLAQCYIVLRDISYKDNEFMAILLIVNLAEMVVNLVFVFRDLFSEDVYIACSLAVQVMSLMIVNLRLQAEDNSNENSLTTSARSMDLSMKFSASRSAKFFHRVDQQLMSRTTLMAMGSVVVMLMKLLPVQRYLIFMVALSLIMRLTVRKVSGACNVYAINELLDKALLLAPVVMVGFAVLSYVHVVDHITGTVLTIMSLVWGLGVMFFALFTVTNGLCSTVPIAFVMLICAGTTSVVYLRQGPLSNLMMLFSCMTVSTSLIFFLSKIKVSEGNPKACRTVSVHVRNSAETSRQDFHVVEKLFA
jgi:hypothetical protein